jgi:glucose/mannose transport system permease protein
MSEATVETARIGYDPLATSGGWRRSRSRFLVYFLLVAFAIYFLLPLFVVIANTFRTLPEVAQYGLIGFPHSFSLRAWYEGWNTFCVGGTCEGIKQNFYNSVQLTIPATIISTAFGVINGYILSKWRFKGSGFLFGAMTLGVFVPGQMALLPWAFILGKLGLTNTISGLVLVHTVQGLSFTTLFCRNYYVGIPDDLTKAARIDGAGFWRIFWKIILPLSPPIIIVTVIWQFTGIWNEFLYGVVFTSGRKQPVTAAIIAVSQSGLQVRDIAVSSTMVLYGALPPLLVYFFGGRYFIRGLTQGAVK